MARPEELAPHRATRGWSCSATPAAPAWSTTRHNPNGATDNIAGIRNARGNVVGLMPHPEHAVDPDVGPTGGQAAASRRCWRRRWPERARERGSGRARGVAAPPAGPDRRRARTDRAPRSGASRGPPSWRCTRRCGPSTAPTSRRSATCARCPPRAPRCSSAPARTPAPWTWATAGRPCSRWSRTRTRRAIEPYQGAATGVGGIVRDIISMGARPVALLDPLMFGPLTRGAEPMAARRRGGGHRRLRELHRRPHRGRRGPFRRAAHREPAAST